MDLEHLSAPLNLGPNTCIFQGCVYGVEKALLGIAGGTFSLAPNRMGPAARRFPCRNCHGRKDAELDEHATETLASGSRRQPTARACRRAGLLPA